MIRMFRIYEDDLQKLELLMPDICTALGTAINDPGVQVKMQEAKRILSDIRWDYGPPQEVHIVKGRNEP